MNKRVYQFAIISLLLSIGLGLFLRLQLNGIIGHIEQLDLRRVHTHIGFYLVFFPIIWLTFKTNSWTPKRNFLVVYLMVSVAALISFLFLGYGRLSKILSGLVLLFWLSYAIINIKRKPKQRGWIHPFLGIFLAAGAIIYIIYLGVQGNVLMAKKAVRMFMTCLLWGVFAPLCLEKNDYLEPRVTLWTLSVALTGLFAMDTSLNTYTFIGPIGIGLTLIFSVFKQQSKLKTRISFYWLATAISFILFGLGVLSNQHAIAIAGLHFFILGPLLQTVFNFKKYKYLWAYDLSLCTMVAAISTPSVLPNFYVTSQIVTNGSSVALVIWMMFFLIRVELIQKNSKAQ